jgi:hypothetical protein
VRGGGKHAYKIGVIEYFLIKILIKEKKIKFNEIGVSS